MRTYKVFDSCGGFLRSFPTYKQAFEWTYSRGGYGRWTIK